MSWNFIKCQTTKHPQNHRILVSFAPLKISKFCLQIFSLIFISIRTHLNCFVSKLAQSTHVRANYNSTIKSSLAWEIIFLFVCSRALSISSRHSWLFSHLKSTNKIEILFSRAETFELIEWSFSRELRKTFKFFWLIEKKTERKKELRNL